MTWDKLGALILFAVALACGQLLFKAASQSIRGPLHFDFATLFSIIFNPYVLLALAIYGSTTIFWVLLLRNVDLSRAYLIVALALVLVPIAGTFLFREPFTARLFIGMM